MSKYFKHMIKKIIRDTDIYNSRAYRRIYFPIARFLVMHGCSYPFMTDERGYWASRRIGHDHGPEKYIKEDAVTYTIFEDLFKVVDTDASFLEIGCNAGRHLNHLLEKGYRQLAGIEINEDSISKMMKETFPELYQIGTFYIGNAAKEIEKIPDDAYDVVFSVAVLEHIHPQDISLFKDMVRVARRYIAVITTENSRVSPYDFERLFEKLGCKTVLFKLFFGDNHGLNLPRERYNEKKHFFDSAFLRVFVKTD